MANKMIFELFGAQYFSIQYIFIYISNTNDSINGIHALIIIAIMDSEKFPNRVRNM